eukprot:SAG11_NODE_20944_length_435_cov_0.830357_1_plen_80_part_10
MLPECMGTDAPGYGGIFLRAQVKLILRFKTEIRTWTEESKKKIVQERRRWKFVEHVHVLLKITSKYSQYIYDYLFYTIK